MKFTDIQSEAIKTLDRNLCVRADAGTGKTLILVQRYIHLLKQKKARVNEILAITFTEKAAEEMKARIHEAARQMLNEILLKQDEPSITWWNMAMAGLDNACIGTIHGFCHRILKENPVEANVDPGFAVLSEIETIVLIDKLSYDFLIARVNAYDKPVKKLLSEFSLDELQEICIEFLSRRDEIGSIVRAYSEMDDRKLSEFLTATIDRERNRALETLASNPGWQNDLEQLKTAPGSTPALDQRRIEIMELAEQLCSAASLDEKCTILEAMRSRCSARGFPSKTSNSGTENPLRQLFIRIKRRYEGYRELIQIAADQDRRQESKYRELLRALSRVFLDIRVHYEYRKRELGVLDFEDLLIKTRDMLKTNLNLRRDLQTRFPFIMVDEYQDINQLQKEIIYYLAEGAPRARSANDVRFGPGRLFIVGDEKQSIYRFRGADVSVFEETKRDVESQKGKTLNLTTNFRTHASCLAYINDLFPKLMREKEGRTDYEPVCHDLKGIRERKLPGASVELLLVDTEDDESRYDARRKEAKLIARKIKSMVEREQYLVEHRDAAGPEWRNVCYGDMAILLRAMSDVKVYEAALKRYGIPSYIVAGNGFYGKQEIIDLVNFLKLVDNRTDRLSLLGVLRAPFFSLSDECLFWFFREYSIDQFFDTEASLESLQHRLSPDEMAKLRFARSHITWLRKHRNMSITQLIEYIVTETGYEAIVGCGFMGEQKIANIRKLLDVARLFENKGLFLLGDFIRYIDRLITHELQEEEVQIEVEGSNVVRIMTIHRAKGLEFPIVIMPDISRRPRTRFRSPVLADRKFGLGLKVRNEDGNRADTALYKLIKKEEIRREEAESKRLFYVANTRARDKLVLSGIVKPQKERPDTDDGPVWMSWLDAFYDLCGSPRKKIDIEAEGKPTISIPVTRSIEGVDPSEPESIETVPPEAPRANKSREGEVERIMARAAVPEADTGSMVKKERYTVTELLVFQECPLRYRLAYEDRIWIPSPLGTPRETLSPAERGDAVHRILARWDFSVSWEQLSALIEMELMQQSLQTPFRDLSPEKTTIENMLAAFTRSPVAQEIGRAHNRKTELPFVVKLPHYLLLEGKIDVFYETPEGIGNLLDYKSGQENGLSENDVVRYEFQLLLYALALQKVFPYPVAEAAIYLLDQQKSHKVTIERERLLKAESEAVNTIEAIRGGERCAQPSFRCKRCPYRKLCESSALSMDRH